MVMGDRIKPGSARAVGQVKKSPDETAGDHSPASTLGPVLVRSEADLKPENERNGAGVRDILGP